MRRITKTVFVHSYRCPKLCWLERHKREAVNDDGSLHSAEGNEVGDLAMKYFGDYIEIPYGKPEDMAAQTAQVLHDSRGKTICEASFVVGYLFCSADILRRRKDGTYDVYEVKSSTHLKDHQLEDSAFQMYVITAAGLKVHSFNLMHINPDYVLGAELDLNALFVVTDITYDVNRLQTSIEGRINECRQLLASDEEPMCSLSKKCDKPFTCPCRDYCFKLNEVSSSGCSRCYSSNYRFDSAVPQLFLGGCYADTFKHFIRICFVPWTKNMSCSAEESFPLRI